MGSWKDIVYERAEEDFDKRLATALGITYDELMWSQYDVDTVDAAEGSITYFVVTFDEEATPEHIYKKMNLDSNGQVRVYLTDLDTLEDDFEYNKEQYEAILSNKKYYDNFKEAIGYALALNKVELRSEKLALILRRQVFITVIGALETFLSDTLINLTDENERYFRNFVKHYKPFKKNLFSQSDIFDEYDKIKEKVGNELVKLLYHNLGMVKNIYETTFAIQFPSIEVLSKYVDTRHDLVHRNGMSKKTKEEIQITKEEIVELTDTTVAFVNDIALKLNLIEYQR